MDEKSQVKVVIKTWDSIYLIPVKDILYCEEDNGCTKFHILNHEPIPASETLNEYETMLSENGFFRIHEKYLVNLRHIIGFENDPDSVLLMDYDHCIPLASRKEMELLEKLNRMASCRNF